jgi:hypothetical protein
MKGHPDEFETDAVAAEIRRRGGSRPDGEGAGVRPDAVS